MFPKTVVPPLEFIVESLAALVLDKAFSGRSVIDNHNPEFRINLPLPIPIAAGCTDFYFGRKDEFFTHGILH